jgi:hypothetical protein
VIVVMDAPPLLRLGEAARRLGWSRGKLRERLDADPPGVLIGNTLYPLRSVQEGISGLGRAGERKVRADDVAAVRAAIDAAIR